MKRPNIGAMYLMTDQFLLLAVTEMVAVGKTIRQRVTLQGYDIRPGGLPDAVVEPCRILELPLLNKPAPYLMNTVKIEVDPRSHCCNDSGLFHGPFRTDPSDRICMVSLGENTRVFATIIIPHSTLFAAFRQGGDPISGRDKILTIPWTEWGPQGSRIFLMSRADMATDFINHGSRFCRGLPDGERRVEVLDFNTRRVHRARQKQEHVPAENWEVVTEATTISRRDWRFTEDVSTSLPYISSKATVPFDFWGALIDEDNLLLVQVCRTCPCEQLSLMRL